MAELLIVLVYLGLVILAAAMIVYFLSRYDNRKEK